MQHPTTLVSAFRLLRPHHWVKNLFVFAPLFFGGAMLDIALLTKAVYIFTAFSLLASAVYIFNDYQDLELDRLHPKKRLRPLAAGLVPVRNALTLLSLLIVIGGLIAYFLVPPALPLLALYLALNFGYSAGLKHVAIVDVVIVSLGFVLRLFAGAFATGMILSKWIVIMTFLLSLFLALAKRRDDLLLEAQTKLRSRPVSNDYNLSFLDSSVAIMAAVTIVAYITFTTSAEVYLRFSSDYLYLTSIFVVVGLMRYLQLTHVKGRGGSPTGILLSDRFTQLNLLAWIMSFVLIIYS